MKALAISAACLVVLSRALTAGAQSASAGQMMAGQGDFHQYCSACHGEQGKGDGPIASSLRRHPANLTELARRNDGTFPADQVARIVDGRKPVPGHGGTDMPEWGDVFGKSSTSSEPDAVRTRIAAIVKYLESIQAKP